MKLSYRAWPALVFSLALALSVAAPRSVQAQSFQGSAPYPAPYTDLRSLVDRSQSDLRAAAELEHGGGKQQGRYHDAQGHLSTFDRHLVKGKFDRAELDKSIGEIKGILDHNTLQASSRDALLHDLDDLRVAKDRHY